MVQIDRGLVPAPPEPYDNKSTILPNHSSQRQSWEQFALGRLPDFFHVLSSHGRITYVSNSCKALTQHEPRQLLGRLIYEFLHPEDYGIFTSELKNSTTTAGHNKPSRLYYRFRSADGDWIILEAQFRPYLRDKRAFRSPITGSYGFVIVARPYPTRNTALLDTFLELKMENERLQRQLEDLKREAYEEDESSFCPENDPAEKILLAESSPPSKFYERHGTTPQTQLLGITHATVPKKRPTVILNHNNTAPQHSPSPENWNGLESEEPSTRFAKKGALVTIGDLGIPIPKPKASKKTARSLARNTVPSAGPRVCITCGTSSTPEWRKGPDGPKTLCNACGLRWKKTLN